MQTGTLWLWLIGLLYRSAVELSGRSSGITLTALIPTVSTWALVWADFIKATTVWWLLCSSWWTTAGLVSSASLFHLTGTCPVQSMQFSSCGVPYRSVNLKLKLKLFNIENVYYHSYLLNIYRQTERAYSYTARKAVPSIFMCHSFITNALHIGRKANWHKLQWCKQRHTTNSCVWSTNACTAILERQSKRNILYNCDTPAMQLALEAAEHLGLSLNRERISCYKTNTWTMINIQHVACLAFSI